MNAKVKGAFKGLRCISSIFEHDDEKSDIQIGFPTDVKHVSHIGFDGPTVDSSPSWMKEFKSSEEVSQPSPLNVRHTKENPEILLALGDSQRRPSGAKSASREIPKSTRRHHSNKELSSSSTHSPTNEKASNPRRCRAKDITENVNSNRKLQVQDNGTTSGPELSQPRSLPEPPKYYRRKKSKDDFSLDSGSARSSSRSKGKRSTDDPASDYNNEESPRSVITNNVSSARSRRQAYTQVS